MALTQYNPTARAASRTMPTGGGNGNLGQGDPVNGYPRGSTTPGYIDYRNPANNGPYFPGTTRQMYNDDPNARKLHSPGSSRGAQSGFRPPSQPSSYAPETPQSTYDERDAQIAARRDATMGKLQGMQAFQDNFGGLDLNDPSVQRQIRNDPAQYAEWKRQRNVAKFNLPEDWNPDPNTNWPKPSSPLGAYSHGPGRPDWDTRFTNPPPPNTAGVSSSGARGATPQANAPMSAGAPPSANPMFEGYLGGGAGVPSGGSGNWGPAGGQDRLNQMYMASQMGGGNPFAGTGGGETGMMYGDPRNMPQTGVYNGPFDSMGRATPGGGMSGGVSPQLINMLMQMRGGGMGGMPMGGGGPFGGGGMNPFMMGRGPGGSMPMGGNMGMMGGGYNPYANPFASSPSRQYANGNVGW